MAGFEYNIDDLYQEAKRRWLKLVEMLYILRNHDQFKFTNIPPQKPTKESCSSSIKTVIIGGRKAIEELWEKHMNGLRLRLVLLVQTVRFYRRSLWIGFAPKESQVLFPASSNMNSFFPAMTKIVGTPDPKSRSIDTISRCLDAGISVSRFDLSCENPNTTKRHWKT
ncbi:hypothetical protein HN873_037032 [Arachis hypogaea]